MKRIVAMLVALMLCLSLVCMAEAGSDLEYVKGNGKLVVGITDFAPMDYKDESGEWVGFDAVWNGMTLTEDVKAAMECSNAYANNAQVVIVPAEVADQYQTAESVADLTIAVENGSAGEEVVTALGYKVTEVTTQADALMEVAAGTSDAAVIDSLMAAAMVGEGTSYANLTYTVGLNSEEYGAGFRKGSDLAAALNDFLKAAYADGSMMATAETYGVQAAIIAQ